MNINSILTSFWSSIKAYLGNNYLGKTAKAESAKSADSVAWTNVSDKPSTYTPSSHTHDDRYYTETEIDTKLNSKTNTSDLSTVATSGSYNDLSNKPTIPTKISDLTNDSGFVADVSGKADKATTLSGYGITDAYTKTQVDKKVSGLVNSAPETLDTLNELASALGNDPNFATTISNQIGNKANTSDLSAVATSGSYNDLSDKPTIPTVNNATLTIQKNGTTVKTFTANASANVTANITVPTKVSDLTNDSGFLTTHQDISGKADKSTTLSGYGITDAYTKTQVDNKIPTVNNATLTIQKNGTTVKTFTANADSDVICNIEVPTKVSQLTNDIGFLETNSIAFHNAYPRCKYLGTSITDAQNEAIKNRTYDDLFIGDYWTINGVNWRIVAIDYYYNIGDTNFDKGNIIVMPDTALYNAQMNETNTTAGAYHGSLMRTQNLNNARTIARNAFGSHLANHRIVLANSVDSSGPNNWSWYDSDGVELPNEVQIYGTRVWGSALKGFDVATQKQQFPLMAIAPQFVIIRQTYWLQDVSSDSVSSYFACVYYFGYAAGGNASVSYGVRPSLTLSYI